MLNTGFSPWPSFSEEEIDAVAKVLRSNRVNYWTGDLCRQFEREFADWVGSRHAVSLTNGTVALDIALKALGIGPGDEVVVTPRTFIASASCVVNAGATPVFADVDRETQGLSAETIARVLSPRTKAIIPVHLGGTPCDMDPIMELARANGLKVIEDCAQAHGAMYRGHSVGTLGDIGAWSFCQDKIMTTGGEGGMVTTDDPALWSAMWSFKDHGKSWEAVHERQHPPGPRLVHESIGTNWRMLEMQAAIGLVQLKRMPEWSARRRSIAGRLAEACRDFGAVRVPRLAADTLEASYRFYAFVNPERLAAGWSRDRIVSAIVDEGVPCYHGSASEVYLEAAFEHTPSRPPHRLPVARELGETSIAMLVHPTLTEDEVGASCAALHKVLARASA
jgi:dTDP-4-amino-4,6-dideoxygalactose transaminase